MHGRVSAPGVFWRGSDPAQKAEGSANEERQQRRIHRQRRQAMLQAMLVEIANSSAACGNVGTAQRCNAALPRGSASRNARRRRYTSWCQRRPSGQCRRVQRGKECNGQSAALRHVITQTLQRQRLQSVGGQRRLANGRKRVRQRAGQARKTGLPARIISS